MNETLLDGVLAALRRAADYNQNDKVAPDCILWPDELGEWKALLPALQTAHGAVLSLGDYSPEAWAGPAIWLRTVIERQHDGSALPRGVMPVLYLPGVGRGDLRDAGDSPPHIQPLAELLYRGCVFVGPSQRDWTVVSFLRASEPGLGLDVAADDKTARAAIRSLEVLAKTPTQRLVGKHLDADEFDKLLIDDLPGQVLRWLDDQSRAEGAWTQAQRQAFRDASNAQLGWDCDGDGPLAASELLAARKHGWQHIWKRFTEAPRQYPCIPALLDRTAPSGVATVATAAIWPSHDIKLEATLRKDLLHLDGEPATQAGAALVDLERDHRPRRDFVWAQLGRAPLACALEHLAALAAATATPIPGGSAAAISEHHRTIGWRADLAALRSLAALRADEDVNAVQAALRSVYLPWLDDGATKLQKHLNDVPTLGQVRDAAVVPAPGDCILFADGLRFDIGELLVEALKGEGHSVQQTWRWAAMPTVTATCKPAVSPIAASLEGGGVDAEFLPHVTASGKPLTSTEFRARMDAAGVQALPKGATGDPTGRGWTEHGDLDKHGHDEGWKLALRVDEQVFELQQRIKALFAAGWQRIRVVTDHGWLMCPGGLSKIELHKNLAQTKWSRCAMLQHDAVTHVGVAGWSWCAGVKIGLAPGASAFWAGNGYAHGGWSPQEAVLPVLEVRPAAATTNARIASVNWVRLRCNVDVQGASASVHVDLRAKASDKATSLVGGGKKLDKDKCKLTVEDDAKEGTLAFIVIVAADGAVLAKQQTTVGGDA